MRTCRLPSCLPARLAFAIGLDSKYVRHACPVACVRRLTRLCLMCCMMLQLAVALPFGLHRSHLTTSKCVQLRQA